MRVNGKAGTFACVVVFLVLSGSLPAAVGDDVPGANPSSSDKSDKPVSLLGARDPILTAFALPKGAFLNRPQQEAYDRLKHENEPILRDAIDKVHKAEGAADKGKAAREVRELRAKLRADIQDILNMPYRSGGDQNSNNSPDGSNPGGYGPQYGNNGGYYPYYNPYRSSYSPYFYPVYVSNGSSTTSGTATGKTTPQSTTTPKPASTAKPVATRPVTTRPVTTKPGGTTTSKH